jgi:wyosine [tRNA(Phe)-imidazoG37] synthetase (radical SAM superfamily)
MNQFVFGPVPSRRLGFSLGVDLISRKHCTYDCIYCQIGKTTCHEVERKRFYDPHAIVREIVDETTKRRQLDVITFSGSGEPTLNVDLGVIIEKVKEHVDLPVAVITNGSLLSRPDVRAELTKADIVLPSLDAVSEDIFRYINRPHYLIDLETTIQGLKQFREDFRGQIWLEVMLIKNVNDDREELTKLKETVASIGVDKVQLNTVVRPPTDRQANRLGKEELENIAHFMGTGCEVVCDFDKTSAQREDEDWSAMVLDIIRRRALSLNDIMRITGMPFAPVKSQLEHLERIGQVKSYTLGEDIFYKTA